MTDFFTCLLISESKSVKTLTPSLSRRERVSRRESI